MASSASIQKISPKSGPVTGGTLVTITGSGFTGANVVAFGKVQAPVKTVSDSQVTVTTPAMPKTGSVNVRVNVPTGLSPVTKQATFKFATPAIENAQFVVVNNTGVPDELVFVKFLGAAIDKTQVAQTYAGSQLLATGAATSSQSYSLKSMTSQLSVPALSGPVPNFALNSYSGGRIYFSLGQSLAATTTPAAQNPGDPDFAKVYAYVEPSVFPTASQGSTNLDASYVDFVGIPISIAIKNASDGSLSHPPANNPLSTPSGKTLFKALTQDANIPVGTQVTANSQGVAGKKTVTLGGTARIMSPSLYVPSLITGALPYHGWTGAGSLIATLRTNKTPLSVASYTSTDDSPNVPKGTLFGFSGSKGPSPIGSSWLKSQNYSLTAKAVADLNPKGKNPRISGLQGKKGIVISGSADVVGAFSIYLTDAALDDPSGVYGANPPYIVDWTGRSAGAKAYSYNGIKNDLSGRVVGDLLAGFNFGWATCATKVADQAKTTKTGKPLAGTVFDPKTGSLAQSAIGALSTGQFFYLLSLQPNTAAVAKWFGASIQSGQPSFYNNYASDFQALTNAYNMAFTDRLQGASDPDMFFTPGSSTYVEITLLPGAYAVTQK